MLLASTRSALLTSSSPVSLCIYVDVDAIAWSPPPSDNCVSIDANGDGCRGIYDEDGGCLVVDPMGKFQPRPEVGVVGALIVPPIVIRLVLLYICVSNNVVVER